MTKRIGLFLGAAPHFGGAFQYTQTILDALANLPRDDFEPVIGYAHSSWPDYLSRYTFETIRIPLGYWGRFFGQVLHYGKINVATWRKTSPLFHPAVRAFLGANCDLWVFPSQDPWCYLSPVPALATIHDLMHRYERRFPEAGNRKEFAWREWHYRNTCRWSRGILVDSAVGKKQVVESYGVDLSKVYVQPYVAPVYLDDFDEASASLSKISLPEKFLFYPAQYWMHKNHENLIRAIGLLQSQFHDIKLVLTGTPKNGYSSARLLVDKLGLAESILFLGYVPDNEMGLLYRRARAMIMPTFFGPTNIPPLEAMYLGCPVAVSDVYGMAEQTKGAALLFDPTSVQSIASTIEDLWGNDGLCRLLAIKGKEVSNQWTQTHFSGRFIEIVRAVTGLSP